MAGLGADILGTWPLGFSSFPEGRVVGLIQIDGPETIALEQSIPVTLALSTVEPPSPIGLIQAVPDLPISLIESGASSA